MINTNFFEDFFAPAIFPKEQREANMFRGGLMKTDVVEKEDGYSLMMNLPGYKKEDIVAELKDGYLIIAAQTSEDKEEKDAEGKFIRRERYVGSCRRKFYVGDIDENSIKAEFTDGVLKIEIPKEQEKVAEAKRITIGTTETHKKDKKDKDEK